MCRLEEGSALTEHGNIWFNIHNPEPLYINKMHHIQPQIMKNEWQPLEASDLSWGCADDSLALSRLWEKHLQQ